MQDHSFLRVPVVLHGLSSLEQSVQEKCAPLMLKGIARCIAQPGPLRNEMINSPDFWAILKALRSRPEVAATVFGIMENLLADPFSTVTPDNYEAVVSLLDDFGSAGRIGSAVEQKQDTLARKERSSKRLQSQ